MPVPTTSARPEPRPGARPESWAPAGRSERELARGPTAASRSATSWAAAWVGASTITRTSGSVPEGRSRIRPASPSSASSSATAAASTASSSARALSTSGTLTSTCGSRVITDGQRLRALCPVVGHPLQHVQGGEDAVAGGGVLAHDHVAGLLAAEGVAGDPHRLEHVAVADLGLAHADAGGPHRLHEAEVAHHGGHDGVLGERGRARPSPSARIARIWSPSTTLPVVVDGQAAVGVAVEREADVGAVLEHGRLQRLEVGGAAAVVDVEPVGLGVDRDHLGAGLAQRPRPGLVGRALGAVEDDRAARRAGGRSVRSRGGRRTRRPPRRTSTTRPTSPPVGRSQSSPSRRLDRDLDGVVELDARRGPGT